MKIAVAVLVVLGVLLTSATAEITTLKRDIVIQVEGELVSHCLSSTSSLSSCIDCCGRTNFQIQTSMLGCHLLCHERHHS